MNKFFRLLHIILFSKYRRPVDITGLCKTPFRVWLNDLDVLRHMNNGVYLSLQDLARVDYMTRAGAAKIISEKGWYPVVASEMIRFKKSLKLFQKFEITTQLISWDDKYLYLEHQFLSGGKLIAIGMIRARFLSKREGMVSPHDLLEALSLDLKAPEFPPHLKSWLDADSTHILTAHSE